MDEVDCLDQYPKPDILDTLSESRDPNRSFSLLRIRKERILPAVTRKNLNTYISCLTTLLVFTAIFEPGAWIKRSLLSVLPGW